MIIAKPHCFDPEVLPLIDNTEKKVRDCACHDRTD